VDAEIFSGHSMYSLPLYRRISQACPSNFSAPPSLACKALYAEMHAIPDPEPLFSVRA
jgi:hypothetical protein